MSEKYYSKILFCGQMSTHYGPPFENNLNQMQDLYQHMKNKVDFPS